MNFDDIKVHVDSYKNTRLKTPYAFGVTSDTKVHYLDPRELSKVFPMGEYSVVLHKGDPSNLEIQYNELLVLMIEEIQTLRQRVKSLESGTQDQNMKTLRDVLEIVGNRTNVELYIKGEKGVNEFGEEMDHRWVEFILLNGKFYPIFEDTKHTDEEIQKEVEGLLDYRVFGLAPLYDDYIDENSETRITPWLHMDIEK